MRICIRWRQRSRWRRCFDRDIQYGGQNFISYSDLDTKGKDFSFNFYPDGKCKIIIGGVSNDGSYAFHQTSVDIQYGGKSQKLSYDHGILTLKLDYNDQTTAYMFTKVSK